VIAIRCDAWSCTVEMDTDMTRLRIAEYCCPVQISTGINALLRLPEVAGTSLSRPDSTSMTFYKVTYLKWGVLNSPKSGEWGLLRP
jgi:hypothetical protein